MEDKLMTVVIGTLAKRIHELELNFQCEKYQTENLEKEVARLKKEKITIVGEPVLYPSVGAVPND